MKLAVTMTTSQQPDANTQHGSDLMNKEKCCDTTRELHTFQLLTQTL